MKLLVIEDHPKLRENIALYLSLRGHSVDTASNGNEGIEKWYAYDVIILDMNLPILSGTEYLQKVRKEESEVPILILTSNSSLDDKIEAFDLGGDDYLTKPFEMRELEARILALGKRRTRPLIQTHQLGKYHINIWERTVREGTTGESIILSQKEYQILEYLIQHRGITKSKSDILQSVWWENNEHLWEQSVTLEAHISTLRKKLGKDIIQTLKGSWYLISK